MARPKSRLRASGIKALRSLAWLGGIVAVGAIVFTSHAVALSSAAGARAVGLAYSIPAGVAMVVGTAAICVAWIRAEMRRPRDARTGRRRALGRVRVWLGGIASVALLVAFAALTPLLGRRARRGLVRNVPEVGVAFVEGLGWAVAGAAAVVAVALAIVLIASPAVGWANYLRLRRDPRLVTVRAGAKGSESVRVLYRPAVGPNPVARVKLGTRTLAALTPGGAVGVTLPGPEQTLTVDLGETQQLTLELTLAPGASTDVVFAPGLLGTAFCRTLPGERRFVRQVPDRSTPLASPPNSGPRQPGETLRHDETL